MWLVTTVLLGAKEIAYPAIEEGEWANHLQSKDGVVYRGQRRGKRRQVLNYR